MSLNLRVPFSDIIGTRDSQLNKDSLTTNVFFDAVPEGEALVKRPGLQNLTSALGLGIDGKMGYGQGIFFYNDIVFSFNAPPFDYIYNKVAVGNGQVIFVAEPPGSAPPESKSYVVILDADGSINSKILPSFINLIESILYTGTHFCIFGSGTDGTLYIIRSVDGISWETVYTLDPTVEEVGKFGVVKTGLSAFLSDAMDYSYTSTDNGATWAVNTTNINTPDSVVTIASDDTTFTNGVHYSTDAITWSLCTGTTVGGTGYNISYGNNKFFSYTSGASAFTSLNGIAWITEAVTVVVPQTTSDGTPKFSFVDGVYSTVSPLEISSGNIIPAAWSSNGLNWTVSVNPAIPPAPARDTYNDLLESVYQFSFGSSHYSLSVVRADPPEYPFSIWFIEKSDDGVVWTSYAIDIALFNPIPTLIAGLI